MKKLLSMFLALCMVVTMLPVSAMAQETPTTIVGGGEIIAFSHLAETKKTVTLGTSIQDLELPETLTATVRTALTTTSSAIEITVSEPEDAGEARGHEWKETTQDIPVTWTSTPEYDMNAEGEYVFAPVIEDYVVGAKLPEITVTVEAVPMMLLSAGAPASVVISTQTVAQIKTAIETALNSEGVTNVTVTGSKTGVTEALILNIPAGKTVQWGTTTYSADSNFINPLIQLSGDGSFEVVSGGYISAATGHAIKGVNANASVIVNGGIVRNNSTNPSVYNSVIYMQYAPSDGGINVTVKGGGQVYGQLSGISTKGSVLVSDSGTYVSATSTGTAIQAEGPHSMIDGGKVTAQNGRAIYAKNSIAISGNAEITSANSNEYQGTIQLENNDILLTIKGGTIVNTSSSGNAIIRYGGTVNVEILAGKSATVKGSGRAMTFAPTLVGTTVTASTIYGGASPVTYNAADIATYKYLKFEPKTAVAQIGSTGYATLQAAVDAIENEQTIKLLDNINLTGPLIIPSSNSTDFTLDLNDKTVDSGINTTIQHEGSGTLTITDTSGSEGGKVTSRSNWNANVIRLINDSNLVISGGTVESTGEGTAIYSTSTGGISVTGGTVKNTYDVRSGDAISNNGTGSVSISGGTVISTSGRAISNYNVGRVSVSGGTVSAERHPAILNGSRGKITISDTAMVTSANTSDSSGTIHLDRVGTNDTVLEITSGTVQNTASTGYAIYNDRISGKVIVTSGSTVIKGGGSVMNKAPTLNDVQVTASTHYDGSAPIAYNAGDISTYKYLKFDPAPVISQIGSTGYTTLQAAVDAVTEGQTIQLLDDITLTDAVIISSGSNKSFTLDLNGKTLTGYNLVVITHKGSGTLTITDNSSGFKGKVTSESTAGNLQQTIILEGGSLEVKDGTVEKIGSGNSISNYGLGSVSISGGIVSAEHIDSFGIYATKDTISIPGGAPIIKGGRGAMNRAPGLSSYTKVKVTASLNYDGSSPVAEYKAVDIDKFKYLTFAISTGTTVTNLALTERLTTPAIGGTPVTEIIAYEQYTGTVTWSGNPTKFLSGIAYTATVTLTAKPGYTFSNIAQNSFTYDGATSTTNAIGYGDILTVTIVFPKTAEKTLESITITTPPSKTAYKYGETFSTSGMVVKAAYNDETENTNFTAYTVDKTDGLTMGDTTITLTANANPAIKTTQIVTINKADSPTAPTGLVGVAPTSAGGTDGKITGTTALMEYATNIEFAGANDCTESVTEHFDGGTTWYVRYKATDTHEAGAYTTVAIPAYVPSALTGTATISSIAPRIGDVLNGSLVGGNNTGTLSYVWKADGTEVATGSSYTVAVADLGKAITLEISSSIETGTITSTITDEVLKKAAPSAPGAPTLAAKTYNTVTLTANAAYEFSKDSITWQTDNVFGSLTPNTMYTFYQRVAETPDTESSASSTGFSVTTDSAPADALTGTATISSIAPRIGDVLNGALVGGNNTGILSYVWKTDGTEVGTGASYTVAVADLGKTITLEISSSIETGTITSVATTAVAKKIAPPAPGAPTLAAKTYNTVTLTANAAYEFSKDSSTWQTDNVFGSLTPNTMYTFYQRVAETPDTESSASSTGFSMTTDSAPAYVPSALTGTATISSIAPRIGDVLNGSLVGGNNTGTLSYVWKADGTEVATGSSYTVAVADLGKAITLEISSSIETGTITSAITDEVLKKAAPSAPGAPTLAAKTYNTVTLTANAAYEFSKDSITWQTDNVFGSLTPNTMYTFYQRVAETPDTESSASSTGFSVTTDSAPADALTGTATISSIAPRIGDVLNGALVGGNNTGILSYVWKTDGTEVGTGASYTVAVADLGKTITLEISSSIETGTITSVATTAVAKKIAPPAPGAPTLAAKTYNTVTLTANAAYEFSKDSSTWQTDNVFGSLTPNTMYTFYQRVAETPDTESSASSTGFSMTTDSAPADALTGTATISSIAPRIGDVLNGALVGGNNTGTLSYVWKVDGTEVGTGASYTVAVADLGKAITLEISSSIETGTLISMATAEVLKKIAPATPGAPTLVSKTYNTVTLTANAAYEFSKDSITWQTDNVFGSLTPNTMYTFYQRVAETPDTESSASSTGFSMTTDSAPADALTGTATISSIAPRIGDVLNGSLVGGNNTGTLSYVWKTAGTEVGTGASYTVAVADLGKVITLKISSSVETGTLISMATAEVLKKIAPATPRAPTLVSKTYNTVTLTANETYEFSKDGSTWQTGNVFSGLTANTAYTFYQRVGETLDTEKSASSIGFSVTTNSNDGGGSGSGGGGSPSDNNSIVIVIPPTPSEPNLPTRGEIKVLGTVDGRGNVTVSITDKTVTNAFEKALADAKKNGNAENGITVVLRVDTGSKSAANVTVNLPKAVQDTILVNKIVSTIVVVENPDISIGMDLEAVQEINSQAKSDVNLTAIPTDREKLSREGRNAIGGRPVWGLQVNYGSGGQVQNFGVGSVSITIPYTLGANEKAENVQAVYIDDSGKVHWLVNSVYDRVEKVLRFSTNHLSIYGVGYRQDMPVQTDILTKPEASALPDISTHWAKDDIQFVISRGLLGGTSTTTFSPNTAMTRGMFVTALGRLANADVSGYKESSFTDVKSDAYYMGYIEWANKNSIVNGTGNGKFAAEQSITREQMAVIMQNYAKVMGFTLSKVHEENILADNAKISAYAKSAVKQMQMAGVIGGKSGNLFDPQGTATRAEVSAVLRRFIELVISGETMQG